MARSLRIAAILAAVAMLAACAGDDHPQSPDPPPDAGLDRESPGVAVTLSTVQLHHGDWRSFIQLLWDGTLRVDYFGVVPERVHEARVTANELADVIALTTDGRMQAVFRGEVEPACEPVPVVDGSKSIFYRHDGIEYAHTIMGCNEANFVAIEEALVRMQRKYLPAE